MRYMNQQKSRGLGRGSNLEVRGKGEEPIYCHATPPLSLDQKKKEKIRIRF